MKRLLLPALLLLALPAAAEDWTQFGGGPERLGRVGETGLAPGLSPRWQAKAGGPLAAGAVLADGIVLTLGEAGRAEAFRARDGAPLWTREFAARESTATPACAAGRAVLGLGDGRLVCLALETGETLWERQLLGGTRAAIAIREGLVLVNPGFPAVELVALDLQSGRDRWRVELPQIGYSSPALDAGLALVGSDGGRFLALDPLSGAVRWEYPTQGRVLLSAPALTPGGVFLLPGGQDPRLYRVDRDDAQWPAANWSLSLNDPGPPGPSWAVLGRSRATSSPVWADGRIICVVRHDSTLDRSPPWFVPDRYIAREWVYAVDGAGQLLWRTLLASQDATEAIAVPPLGTCPSPVVLNGDALVCASSLEASLVTLTSASGQELERESLAGQRWAAAASPALANGLLVLPTAAGELHAWDLGGNDAPSAPAALTDEDQDSASPLLRWSPARDPDDPASTLRYEVRVDADGEVLLDAQVQVLSAPGQTSLQLVQELAGDRRYRWQVRARDPQGACSAWSPARSFRVALVPEPPRAFQVVEVGPDRVRLSWEGSPSPFVSSYWIRRRELPGGSFGAPLAVGRVAEATLAGLQEGTRYEFRLTAISSFERESSGLLASARVEAPVQLNGSAVLELGLALVQAQPGDVVQLGAGTYHLAQSVSLSPNVILRGAGPGRTRLAAGGSFPVVSLGPNQRGIRLEQLSLFAGTRGVEVAAGAALELVNVLLYDLDDALVVEDGGELRGEQLSVVANRGRGLLVESGGRVSLRNSIVVGNDVGLECRGQPAELELAFLAVSENRSDDWRGCEPLPGSELLASFRDPDLRDYRVLPATATVDAGDPEAEVGEEPYYQGERINLGAFAGTPEAATSARAEAAVPRRSGGSGCAIGAESAPSRLPAGVLVLGLLVLGALRRRRVRGRETA